MTHNILITLKHSPIYDRDKTGLTTRIINHLLWVLCSISVIFSYSITSAVAQSECTSDPRYPRPQDKGMVFYLQRSGNTNTIIYSALFNASGNINLNKPFDVDKLKTTIISAFELGVVLNSDNLNKFVAGMHSIPSIPSIYAEISEKMQSSDSKLSDIASIIESDAGMTVKILQLVNSPFFGLPNRISSIQHAVQLLGLETLKILVLSNKAFAQFKLNSDSEISLHIFMTHSAKVASFARLIAKHETQATPLMNDAYLAGMLHDIGKLVFATNLPKPYDKLLEIADRDPEPLWQMEKDKFGACHAEVGAYLLKSWNLPSPVIESVAFHHKPRAVLSDQFHPLTSVYSANCIDKAEAVDEEYLNSLGLSGNYSNWQQLCSETVQQAA